MTTDSHVDENDVVELIQGSLASSRRDEVEAHLDVCPDCRELLVFVSKSDAVERKKDSTGETLVPWNEADVGATQRTQIVSISEGLFRPDTLVDNFQIIRFLDRGGMGEVYLARDVGLGRRVALKVIRQSHLKSKRTRSRFLFEARATARFNHPHIVAIHSVGEFRGLPYVALEYLEGESLRERMNRERLGSREAIRVARAIASALEEAHQHGIIHRDLKPENVLIPRDGRPRVVDFGLATAFEDESLERLRAGSNPTVLDPGSQHHKGGGTPSYMAPEQWTRDDTDGATDIWALGVILYEMLAARRPYHELEESRTDLARRVMSEEPPPRISGEVLRGLPELVAWCLEKDRTKRPTATDVLRTLDALTDRKGAPVKNPFRGLLPFGERHADLFFGRDAEVAAAVERLRDETVLAIVGPSGAGKSSFVQAGIIPRLREHGPWSIIKLRPGSEPFHALAGRVISGEETGEFPEETFDHDPTRPPPGRRDQILQTLRDETFNLSRELVESPYALALHLNRMARERGGRVLLFVDQLEELSTLVKSDKVRASFMRAIIAASEDREGPIRVVLTVRDDFLGRLALDEQGREALSRVMVVKSPGSSALHEVLSRPAESQGYRFDPGLVDRMVEEVEGEPAALPLLSFAANLLWERRDEARRALTTEAYQAMGGVAGALADHADGVLFGMSAGRIAVAKQALLRMVTADRTRKVITREQALEGLGPEAEDVLGRLVRSRLVTIRRALMESDDETQLELVHESLVRTWKRLARWLDESREELTFLEQVGQAAALWEKRGRRDAELWEKEALFEAVGHLSRLSARPSELVAEFLAAGQRRESKKRRRLLALGAGAMIGLSAMMLFLIVQKNVAEEQRSEARSRWAEAQREGARVAAMRGNLTEARAKIRGSLETEDSSLARVLWWDVHRRPLVFKKTLNTLTLGVAFSPDGATVAAACSDGTAKLIDVETESIAHLRGYGDQLIAVAFSPDGGELAAGTWDGRLAVRDLERKTRQVRAHTGGVMDVAYAPDGAMLATAGTDQRVVLWDPRSLEERTSFSHGSQVAAIAWSPDGKSIAAATRDPAVVIWSIQGAKRTLEGHRGALLDVAFSPDGKRLATASADLSVRLWDLESGTSRELIGHSESPRTLGFSANGALLASGGIDRTIRIWDVETGSLVALLEGHEDSVTGIAFAPTGRRLASVGFDNELRFWDVSRAVEIERPRGHEDSVAGATFSPDGRRFATASSDDTVRIWNLSGEEERVLRGHTAAVVGVAWSPDGRTIASGGNDQTVRLWDARTGAQKRALYGHQNHVIAVAFSPDGTLLASAGRDATIRLWRLESGALAGVLRGHEGGVWSVVFSRDGKRLASSGRDGTIRLWDLKKQKIAKVLGPAGSELFGLAFFDEDTLISGGEDGAVRAWSLESGDHEVKARLEGRIYRLAIAPDRTIGAPTSQGVAHLLGERNLVLRGHHGETNCLRFSPDGKLAVTTGDDRTVRLWRTATGEPLWRAPLLSSGGRSLPEGGTKWRARALAARFTHASGDLICCAFDGEIEAWSISRDERLLSAAGRADDLRSTGLGCLALIGGSAKLTGSAGTVELGPAQAIEVDGVRMWIGSESGIAERDAEGRTIAQVNADVGISAVGRAGEWWIAGYRDGSLELIPPPGTKRPAFSFEGTPSSPVSRIAAGPSQTLAAGYQDGSIGLWAIDNGRSLAQARLHGPIRALAASPERLFAATDLGSSLWWDLSDFSRDYCELLSQVWAEVPIVWEGGLPVLRAAPSDHRCRR